MTPHLMRVSVVLLLLKVSESHLPLSMAQRRSDLTRYERFAGRRDRHCYILHVSAADLQPAVS
jgi:hypothetical protein